MGELAGARWPLGCGESRVGAVKSRHADVHATSTARVQLIRARKATDKNTYERPNPQKGPRSSTLPASL